MGFQDIREGVTFRRLILQGLECTYLLHAQNLRIKFPSWKAINDSAKLFC